MRFEAVVLLWPVTPLGVAAGLCDLRRCWPARSPSGLLGLPAEDGDVRLCYRSCCPGNARGELGDTRALGPDVMQQQQQLCVWPHKGSALCHVPPRTRVSAAQSTFRGTELLVFLHTSHLHCLPQPESRIQPPGTHLQPGITSDLGQF